MMAEDLIRTRQHIKKFVLMKRDIQVVLYTLEMLKNEDVTAKVGSLAATVSRHIFHYRFRSRRELLG